MPEQFMFVLQLVPQVNVANEIEQQTDPREEESKAAAQTIEQQKEEKKNKLLAELEKAKQAYEQAQLAENEAIQAQTEAKATGE